MGFPPIVNTKLGELNPEQKNIFYKEYGRRKKSVLIGYILLIPLGWHYAYVNKWGIQILCFLTLWGFLIWWFIDWFRLPSIIKRYNDELAIKIMVEYATLFPVKNVKSDNGNEEFLQWKRQNPTTTINDFYSRKNK